MRGGGTAIIEAHGPRKRFNGVRVYVDSSGRPVGRRISVWESSNVDGRINHRIIGYAQHLCRLVYFGLAFFLTLLNFWIKFRGLIG